MVVIVILENEILDYATLHQGYIDIFMEFRVALMQRSVIKERGLAESTDRTA